MILGCKMNCKLVLLIILLAACRSPEPRAAGWTLPFVTKVTKYEVGTLFTAHHKTFMVKEVSDRYYIMVLTGGDATFWMSEKEMDQAMGHD